MEKMLIRGVAKDDNVARLSLVGLKDVPGIAFKVFEKLAQKKINVDIILQSIGRDGTKDIAFTVAKDECEAAMAALESFKDSATIACETNITKVSIVGAGMESHPDVAARMFEALYSAGINIRMISSSEIRISVLIDAADGAKAVEAVHAAFIG